MSTRIAYERVPASVLRQGDVIILDDSRELDYPAVPCVVTGISVVFGGVNVVTGIDVDYMPADRLVCRLFAVAAEPNRFSVAVMDRDRDDVALFPSEKAAEAYAAAELRKSDTAAVLVEPLGS